jgi:hypothetical protein
MAGNISEISIGNNSICDKRYSSVLFTCAKAQKLKSLFYFYGLPNTGYC